MSSLYSLTVKQKYDLYENSVQNPEADIDFINKQYQAIFGKSPYTLREDFGGTGYLACLWAAQSSDHRSYVIDLDREPIDYGIRHHYAKLNEQQKQRVEYREANVLADLELKTDVIVAFNFSYFIFKKRKQLLDYFGKVLSDLTDDGVFCMDLFGGTDAREPSEEETEHDDHDYIWDCDRYNPLTNECLYHIHFRTHSNGIKHQKVFTYDWRMWSMAELKDILEEVGFSNVYTYWEGEDEDGDGDGNFYDTSDAENCESWVSYIIAKK